MNYQINKTTFKIGKQAVTINNKIVTLKHATFEALVLFLQSNGNVVSKDDLLDHIWKDVIVSDASAFKQVQLVKEIFAQAGLPKDTIENIYGKGYKVKYKILETAESETNHMVFNTNPQNKKFSNKTIFSAVLIVVLISFGIFYLSESNIKEDFLSLEKRESMVSLMNNDWEKGLQHVNSIIENDKMRLSKGDFAFLHGKKGLCEYHLQDYEKSITTYQYALKLFKDLDDHRHMGQVHLNIAESQTRLPSEGDYYEIQQQHINTAIELFKKSDSPMKMIDAQMTLAHFYKKNGKIQKSIKLYEKTITDANKLGDTAGAMIANNNLAATYLIINDYDKAIELGQQGLQMALAIGKGRYIASSYSFLSDLYQHQYKSKLAMQMLEQAIKYQLSNNEFTNLGPKIITLDFLLTQTYQYQKADELLILSDQYAQSMKMKNGVSIISLYKGLNAARQSNWNDAEINLKNALEVSQRSNFKYKQPLNLAYLALTYYFNNNYLQAIEPAMSVLNDEKSEKQAKAIAALALAYTYDFLEKPDLANQWFSKTQELQNPKWLFEYQLFLKLKLERQQRSDSILIAQTEKEILEVSEKMTELAQLAQIDETIYSNLKLQIIKKVESKEIKK